MKQVIEIPSVGLVAVPFVKKSKVNRRIGGFFAALCSVALAAPCSAAVIVSDAFSGSSGVDLAGTNAVVSQGVLDAGGSATWVANTAFNTDGSVAFGTGASGLARLSLGDYIWNARGTQNGVFTLTATVSITSGTWISVGFFHTEAAITTYFSNGVDGNPGPGIATAINRFSDGINSDNYYGRKGTAGNSNPGVISGTVTFTIKLDLSSYGGSNYGTVTFSNNLGIGTATTVALASDGGVNPFLYVGFSGNNGANGTISNFSLEQIPEPSAMLLLLTLPVLGFSRRR